MFRSNGSASIPLVPAKAGTQFFAKGWIPAFAGMSGAPGCLEEP
jgi:hypothetical protein